MRSRRDIVAEVPFGDGKLVVEQVMSEVTKAFADGRPDRGGSTRKLIYVNGHGRKSLSGLHEIVMLAEVEGVSIAASVAKCPTEYATILSAYKALGTVVKPTPRFTYLRSYYGIDLDEHRPRICGEALCFAVIQASLDAASFAVLDVRWNLSYMTYETVMIVSGPTHAEKAGHRTF